jgi:hypothetical protein
MECAYKNDIKQLTILRTFVFTFTTAFGLGILQSPPLIYALSSVHYVHIYKTNFKNSQKYVGIFPTLHPHAPKYHPQDRTRSIGPLQSLWLDSGDI